MSHAIIGDRTAKICVIGLGYVGLPLAVEFGAKYDTVGFDIKESRLEQLRAGHDLTREITPEKLQSSTFLTLTNNPDTLRDRDIFIITVPTPIDQYTCPDLRPLIGASQTVGKAMKKGAIVIYESTVYPGCTEEDCVAVLEKFSGLKFNHDFFCGYSPERINPGDKEHTLTNICKITSGSTPEAADLVDELYNSILKAGTHRASSIKVAEAAKVIENTQRDMNIAFVNELSKIFHLLGIDTTEVLEAAGTKWNFLKFKPGLVGGHCIGVDPYYLTHKALAVGYHPEVILSGRRINDGMSQYIASEVIKLMIKKGHTILNARVLQLGITFKENCVDIRNSHAVGVVRGLKDFGCAVDLLDPWANPEEVRHEYGLEMYNDLDALDLQCYDAVVLAVAHKEFADLDLRTLCKPQTVVFDVKGVLAPETIDGRL